MNSIHSSTGDADKIEGFDDQRMANSKQSMPDVNEMVEEIFKDLISEQENARKVFNYHSPYESSK